ncbi:MAG: hypothetical protein SGJ09_05515 [Phycisphaerae bacterium]|nr:hypothetical protein [Phycisphaerae bacterium]
MTTAALATSTILAHIPFVEPLPLAHRFWWLLIVPLAIGVSMAWKAVRVPSLGDYWRQVASMSVQIVLGVAGIAVGLFVLIQVVLPRLPAE